MPQIHPTAVVDPAAELASDVVVGPLCYVGPKVRLGPGCRLMSQATILGNTTIGSHNVIWPHATIGGDPQDLKFRGEDSLTVIGDHNEIRENVTIHKGTANGGNVTRLGDHNLLMVGSHVAHDCVLGSHVILANAALLAGHIVIHDHVTVSGASAVHHFVTIGEYAFVGGMTRVVHDVPPFMILEGTEARIRGVNVIGVERAGFTPEQLLHLKDAYRLLFRGEASGSLEDRLSILLADFPDDATIATLVAFMRRKSQGLLGRYRESHRQDARHRRTMR